MPRIITNCKLELVRFKDDTIRVCPKENNCSHTTSSMKPQNDLRKCSLSVGKYVSMHLINLCLLIMGKCFSTPPSDVERHKTVITCIMRQGR